MRSRVDLAPLFAIDAEARRVERERCVRLAREHALLAATDDAADALRKLADEMESPDA